MKFSLIICTRNRVDVLINNLKYNLHEFSLADEIIIVDSSYEDYAKKFKTEFNANNIHYYKTQAGLPFQRNYGISKAIGDIFLFLDDDIQLYKGSINNLRNFFINNPEIDGVTGALTEKNEPSKIKQFIETVFSKVFFTPAFGKAGITKSGLPIIPLASQPYHSAAFLRGGFSAYKRGVFKDHFFDERFNGYAYLEDTDFSLSIRKIGDFVFLPEFKGFHDHLSSLQKDHSIVRKQYIENFHYIFKKYNLGTPLQFYWTVFGVLIINFVKSITSLNFSYTSGILQGIISIIKR